MSTAQPTRRESFWPNHFCPCGVVQLTRLPLMQEITGAKPVRDANFHVPKAFSAMHSFGMGASSVQFRVGAPNSEWWQRTSNRRRTSVQAGVISQPRPGQHWGLRPFSPPCSSLRISFVEKLSRGSTGWRLHFLCSRSPTAETRRRERRQCRCESCRGHQFHGAEATVDRHRTFNPPTVRLQLPPAPPFRCGME